MRPNLRLGRSRRWSTLRGVMYTETIVQTEEAVFDHIFAVNAKGIFNTLRLASSRLRDGGLIVNFSTSVLGLALPGYAAYVDSKLAIVAFTRLFANELRGLRISVTAVAPGPTGTDLFFEDKSQELIDRFANQPPLERLGQPDDIANVVAFLVGPEGGWINGQAIRINGGIV